MLNALLRKDDRVLVLRHSGNIQTTFIRLRNRAAEKLKNPRLHYIKFHTLRHWKATMESHKTKDILHVKEMLGHRGIENTLLYTQRVTFENDDYYSALAKTIDEAIALIEDGFEYVCDLEGVNLSRKTQITQKPCGKTKKQGVNHKNR